MSRVRLRSLDHSRRILISMHVAKSLCWRAPVCPCSSPLRFPPETASVMIACAACCRMMGRSASSGNSSAHLPTALSCQRWFFSSRFHYRELSGSVHQTGLARRLAERGPRVSRQPWRPHFRDQLRHVFRRRRRSSHLRLTRLREAQPPSLSMINACTLSAATSCMCGSTWEYTSSVKATLACPSCSLMTLGDTPAASEMVAAVWRRS